MNPFVTSSTLWLQTLGGAIGPADASRLAWSLAALDALREDAAQALAPQLSALSLDDAPSLVRSGGPNPPPSCCAHTPGPEQRQNRRTLAERPSSPCALRRT